MTDILKKVLDIQDFFYQVSNLHMSNFSAEDESIEYYAHFYDLNKKKIKFRIAKKTPNKTGWFVALWKRSSDGNIAPYDASDKVDIVVIVVVDQDRVGQFVFPRSILLEKNIFSQKNQDGKRACRLYSPWDDANSLQAQKSKQWQSQFFVDLSVKNDSSINRVRELYDVCYSSMNC